MHLIDCNQRPEQKSVIMIFGKVNARWKSDTADKNSNSWQFHNAFKAGATILPTTYYCSNLYYPEALPITKRCMEMSFTGHNANHVHDFGYINGSRPTLREIHPRRRPMLIFVRSRPIGLHNHIIIDHNATINCDNCVCYLVVVF